MRVTLKCVRRMTAYWWMYQDRCEDLLGRSSLGYPSETAESRYEREGGARGSGGGSRAKVPCRALDELRMGYELEEIDRAMRMMPKEYRQALEVDYRGAVKQSQRVRHKNMLQQVVIWWSGWSAQKVA